MIIVKNNNVISAVNKNNNMKNNDNNVKNNNNIHMNDNNNNVENAKSYQHSATYTSFPPPGLEPGSLG